MLFRSHFPVQPHTVEPFEGQEEEVAEYIGGNETILLVEDEEMLLEMVKNMLEMIGYTILIAKNGFEAVEVYKEHKDQIAFVLSDMGLPKLGGFEAFLEMKKINPKVKAILASGYLDPSLRLGLLKAGAIDFVQKPYDPKQICKKIRQILDAGKK